MVLTAGHCVVDPDGSWDPPQAVRLGADSLLGGPLSAGRGERHAVLRAIVHPAFARRPTTDTESDLALLLLAGNSSVAPVRLPPPGMRLRDLQRVWTAGYRRVR